MRALFVGVIAAMASIGCEKAAKHGDHESSDRPADLLLAISGTSSITNGVRDFANAAKPGAGLLLSDDLLFRGAARMVGVSSLDGIDHTAPLHILLVGTSPHPTVALVARVKDDKLLHDGLGSAIATTRDGWAVIGPKPAVDDVASYALATLVAAPATTKLTATIYFGEVMKRYRGDLEAGRTTMLNATATSATPQMKQLFEQYFDGTLALADDTAEIHASLEATGDAASLDVAFVPKARSRLAEFAAAQQPSDYALLAKLPAIPAPVVVGGHLALGPYRDGLATLMAAMYGGLAANELGAIMKVATGEIAVTAQIVPGEGMSMTQIAALDDTAAADAAIGKVLASIADGRTVDMGTMRATYKAVPGTTQHDGVTLRRYDTTLEMVGGTKAGAGLAGPMVPAGAKRAQLGTFDRMLVVAAGPDDAAGLAIDAARGKGPHYTPSAYAAALLETSRANKDSVAVIADFAALRSLMRGEPASDDSHPLLMSLGFADHLAHLRIIVPSATIRTLIP